MKAGIIAAVLLVSLGLQGCSHERSNRLVKGFNPSPWVDPGKPVEAEKKTEEEVIVEEISQLEKISDKAKKQHVEGKIKYDEGK